MDEYISCLFLFELIGPQCFTFCLYITGIMTHKNNVMSLLEDHSLICLSIHS